MDTKKLDRETIIRLGGPAKVCDLLGLDKRTGGVQRVQNWLERGIPAQMKLDFPILRGEPPRKQSRRKDEVARA